MERIRRRIRWKAVAADPIQAGDIMITPVSRAFTLTIPYFNVVWNRPHSVKIQNGEESRSIAIVDVTRRAQISIYGIGALLTLVVWILGRKNNQSSL